ncbi:MAG: ATP-dependent 6-phosphofructokinase [Acetobacteraceae bacterium]|nr:ATP-dependent 6-phosphofructokinase [Acetobacteraceae bacterium]
MPRIGVMTTGGDCAGLNAAIRAVVATCTGQGAEVLGILKGTEGLMADPPGFVVLDAGIVDGPLLRQGGTTLGSVNRGNPLRHPMPDGSTIDFSAKVKAGYQALRLDNLVAIGGDGSMRIMAELARRTGIRFIGVPKTIDNDLAATDSTIGFATAVEVAVEALDRLQPTAASHSRIMVLEVMGRDSGHIALSAGIAGGADVILIPEIPWRVAAAAAAIARLAARGRNYALVVVAEAVRDPEGAQAVVGPSRPGAMPRLGGIGGRVAAILERATGAEARVTVLGHVQRGGQPGATDRVLAAGLGVRAAELALAGVSGRMVAVQGGVLGDVAIDEAVAAQRPVDPAGQLVATARALGISMGDA